MNVPLSLAIILTLCIGCAVVGFGYAIKHYSPWNPTQEDVNKAEVMMTAALGALLLAVVAVAVYYLTGSLT
jgi:hypothetical protein